MPTFRKNGTISETEDDVVILWNHPGEVRVRLNGGLVKRSEWADVCGISAGEAIPYIRPDRKMRMTGCQGMPNRIV
jgi:hypothetical protein